MIKRENADLTRTIEDVRLRYEERLQFKDSTIKTLNEQIDELQGSLQSQQKNSRGVDNQVEELRRENGQLRDQIMQKFARELNDDALNREIAAVRDPASFAAVKAILSRMVKQKDETEALRQEIANAGNLNRAISEVNSKNKQKDSEIKTLQVEVKKLMSQNEFLLREFEFIQKKYNQGKKVSFPQASAFGDSTPAVGGGGGSDFHSSCVREVIFLYIDM